ncbi:MULTISPECIES: hypothetical protein [Streptomyces]|uniref:Thiazolylpeptide-type bacteriocin n=1 Tax=Streptomyces ramulosus TaxID=47762 RepID=A0ABW1FJG5_9ACTN
MPAAMLEDFDLDIREIFDDETDGATAAKAETAPTATGMTCCC